MQTQCKCGCGRDGLDYRLYLIFIATQGLIKRIDKSNLELTCAMRCEEYNKKIGGHPQSYHPEGLAMDLVAEGLEMDVLAYFVKRAILELDMEEKFDVVVEKDHVHVEYDRRKTHGT